MTDHALMAKHFSVMQPSECEPVRDDVQNLKIISALPMQFI